MLEEFKDVAQQKGVPGHRRWFSDADMELIVWYSEENAISGFQLCYDRAGRERAFTWRAGGGMVHMAVDGGEDTPLRNDTPILVPGGVPNSGRALAQFKERSTGLDAAIVSRVIAELDAFSGPR